MIVRRIGDETYVFWRGQLIYKVWHATKWRKRSSKVMYNKWQP